MSANKAPRTPSLRHHKPTGQAFVEIGGRRHYLGKHDLPETNQAYHRLIAEWIAGGYRLPVPQEIITVLEVSDAYSDHAEGYYVGRFGEPTVEYGRIQAALRPVAELYGHLPAVQFGPIALRAVRQTWVDRGLSLSTINSYTGIVRRMFRWAASQEMLPVTSYQALATLPGLRRGRGMGKDPQPRQAVPKEHVDKTIEYMPSPLRAIIRLLMLTGARPTEILRLKKGDIDQTEIVWVAIIRDHKMSYQEKERRLFFGPKAQQILKPFLLRGDDEYLFSPREAEAERHAACETHRPKGTPRNPKKTRREIGCFYDHTGLNKAIARVCKEQKIPKWTPYQLRHLAATTIEATADLETASAILGHTGLDITQVYVHRDKKAAAAWAAAHG